MLRKILCVVLLCCSVLFAPGQEALRLPTIPASLTTPDARAAYLVEHYWDYAALDAPRLLKKDKVALEQFFVDYLSVLPLAPTESQAIGISNMFAKAGKSEAINIELLNLAEAYLYDPSSPMADDELYMLFLEAVLQSDALSHKEVIRPQGQLEMLQQNSPGTLAPDFSFTLPNGRLVLLSCVLGNMPTLLLLYDAECDHCYEVIEQLKTKPTELKIVAVCVSGSEKKWRKKLPLLPKEWTIGYAGEEFYEEDLYLIRTFPAVYLLDSTRHIIARGKHCIDAFAK